MNIVNLFSHNSDGSVDNPNIIEKEAGPFTIIERRECKSPTIESAVNLYFFNKLGGRVRQLFCNASEGIVLQNGAMQAIVGDVNVTTGIKGVGDLIRQGIRGKASGEAVINPHYHGRGYVITEPTIKYLIPLNLEQFGGSAVLEDGYFYACEEAIQMKTVSRKTISSMAMGNEGLFNLQLAGKGKFILESEVAPEDLVLVYLNNETLKLDGSMAIAWSGDLRFTVGKSSSTLIGSAVNGEGLVNIYEGTGLVIYKALSRY